jgi:alpha-L-fucosidase
MLIDIVSKNGNLLLNLPLHPDGSLDDDELAFLGAMGRWMKVNGEGIYGTRPWVIYGEGPAKGGGGHFNESATHYTSRDFRYTAKGESQLYAFFMKWPEDARLQLCALAKTAASGGTIERVELLGQEGILDFQHSDQGLTVSLPDTPPCQHAWALRISGQQLREFQPRDLSE